MSEIEGKSIAITGAGGGIGAATACHLAARGARVVLADLEVAALQRVAAQVENAGGSAAIHRTDVRRREDLAALVNLAIDRFGRLDVLVNNAGVGPVAPIDDLRVDDWDRMIDVNIKGVLHGIAAALPLFRKQGSGHVVNVASVAGMGGRVSPNMAVYGATKLAVRTISEGLRVEAGDKLRVTVVSPGFVRTTFTDGASNAELREQLNATRDRMAIAPEAIARAIAFAIEQPADVDINEIVVRPTAQS